jgi:hypothetical protein
MKKSLITTTLLLTTSLFISGCASKEIKPTETAMEIGEYQVLVEAEANKTMTEGDLFYKDMIKRVMKKSAETTLQFQKTNFSIINITANNTAGFPINTYKNLQKFCESDLNSYECSAIKNKYRSTLKLLLLSDVDYRIITFDAKEVLEDIKKEEENK